MELSDPIISINGLGPKAQEKLNARDALLE
jgi:hypothetical protein